MSGAPNGAEMRSFLFLQGPTSRAFRDLGQALAARGHKVLKVNFCPGDWLFWHGRDTTMYLGARDRWPDRLRALIRERGVTDIIYFADRFPYHKAAQSVAQEEGVRCVSMEYGYLRPDWLILEEGGQSTYSHVPADPAAFRKAAAALDPVDEHVLYSGTRFEEEFSEASFHLSNGFLGWLTPRYRPNRYYPVLIEFPAYIPRFIRRARNEKEAEARVRAFQAEPKTRFLVPMQMQSDYQLRDNAPAGFQEGFIRQVMTSFRDHAPADAELIFKLHPMDQGLERWERRVPRMAREIGIADRCHFLDGGDLGALFGLAAGCVVINSTMGLISLRRGVPTKAMGIAIYDIEGMTHGGPLDSFWTAPQAPDRSLVRAFVRAIAHGIHVRGTIYGDEGRAAFVQNAIERLESDRLNRHGLYDPRPPRLDKAEAIGVRVDWPMRRKKAS
ncbi:capsular biosynthesis protein [Maritimibacter sp. DP07]|uniref:Capsular biosynthesis protein n=1 Tax=Maritimibacter harenae TaxID=2606218 RepID=A0A845M2M5_9RHOB|nr:capsular biosynthesis protein [Maritimibacter harenae]MZR12588.1 capsular biosynthesis protein [Maritimibacter harenae]